MMHFRRRHRLIAFLQGIDIRGIRYFSGLLPQWILPKPAGPVMMETLHGFPLHIDPVKDNGVERSLYYTGTYEKGTLHIMKQLLQQGDVFVDVGANIGLMSIFALQCVGESGKVVAFEPNPETLHILRQNAALNAASNLEIAPFAVGSTPTQTHIYDRWDENRGSASLIKPDGATTAHSVEVTTLDLFFAQNPTPVHVIKMDIEGYEIEALHGATGLLTQAQAPMLIVECSNQRNALEENPQDALFTLLSTEMGYLLYKLRKGKGAKSKLTAIHTVAEMPRHDNIFAISSWKKQALPANLFHR